MFINTAMTNTKQALANADSTSLKEKKPLATYIDVTERKKERMERTFFKEQKKITYFVGLRMFLL